MRLHHRGAWKHSRVRLVCVIVKRPLTLTLLAALLLTPLPLAAQTIEAVPFDKQLKLAKVGDVDAQFAVGLAYESGREGAVDEAEAARWYRQAALQGQVEAQYRLARLVTKGAKGLKKDPATGLKLFTDAAIKGYAPAMNALGVIYQTGQGAAVDLAKAADWYRKAADLKLAEAENNLGMMYLNGKGLDRDLVEAFKLFDRAAAQGDGWGLNNLGGMYEMGWGTAPNRDKALDLYRQALAKGVASAQANIDRLSAPAPQAQSQ